MSRDPAVVAALPPRSPQPRPDHAAAGAVHRRCGPADHCRRSRRPGADPGADRHATTGSSISPARACSTIACRRICARCTSTRASITSFSTNRGRIGRGCWPTSCLADEVAGSPLPGRRRAGQRLDFRAPAGNMASAGAQARPCRPPRWRPCRASRDRGLVRGARLAALRIPAPGLGARSRRGQDGLLHATTGAGKTYALWFGALQLAAARARPGIAAPPLTVLWLSPMRALGADTARALQAPLAELRTRLDGRRAHRRHRRRRARGAGAAAADRAGHHAGEPDAAAGRAPTREARSPASAWSSSTNGTRCSATSAACRCSWRWRGCGAGVRTCRPGACPRRSATCRTRWPRCCRRLPARPRTPPALRLRARRDRRGRIDKQIVDRHAAAGQRRALSVGRPSGHEDAAGGGRRDWTQRHRRWSSPTPARRRSSGTRRCSTRGPTGPA